MFAPSIPKALLSCLLLAAFVPAQQVRVSGGVDPRKNCGTYCVGIVLDRLGLASPGFDALREALETDAAGLTDLGKIARYLRSRGVRVTQSDRSTRPDSICIGTTAIFNGDERTTNHFVVVEPTGDEVIYYYPPLWTSKQTWNAVHQELGDVLLVVSPAEASSWVSTLSYLLIALGGLLSLRAWRIR